MYRYLISNELQKPRNDQLDVLKKVNEIFDITGWKHEAPYCCQMLMYWSICSIQLGLLMRVWNNSVLEVKHNGLKKATVIRQLLEPK